MKIVIDIPEKDYQVTLTKIMLACRGCKITELPKRHGDLIDRQELQNAMEKDIRKAMSFVDLTDFVWLAPTIIEAEE